LKYLDKQIPTNFKVFQKSRKSILSRIHLDFVLFTQTTLWFAFASDKDTKPISNSFQNQCKLVGICLYGYCKNNKSILRQKLCLPHLLP